MSATVEEIQEWQRVVGATPDGVPGPKTFAATVAWLRDHGYIKPPELPSETRAKVVAIARAELGLSSAYKYFVRAAPQYVGTKPGEKSWCGVFALWCLRQAGLTDKTWVDGKGFAMGWLPVVQLPEPGDIAYFNRFQHYAIVERCENGRVWLINGNGAGGKVTASDRPISDAALYFSIGRLG